ncbi:MAG: MmgE/PrpD family protein [Betaproteobacteria bacterium]|nr:MmgE/PrpD family protein [Betaproteobacteria bacterium]
MGLTEELCRLITATRADTLGAECVRRAKRAIMDGIAVAVAGAREPPVKLLAAHIKAQGGARQSSVWGYGFRTSSVQAAYVNGVATHVLDFEPMWLPPTHAVSPTLPVGIALAEARRHGGREVIAAIAKGMEIQGRIQFAADQFEPERLRFHPPGITGVIGAAVTAGHLLSLDATQLGHALGIAASRAGSLLANIGSMTKATHCGYAAASGLDAALLASRGFTANAAIFEAPRGFAATFFPERFDAERLLAYGRPFRIVDPGFAIKCFPSQFATHWAIRAALEARERIGDPRAIERVVITAPLMQYIDRPRPATGLDGKFSFQYTAAVALLDGKVSIDSFSDKRRFRPDMEALLGRIELRQDPSIPGDWRGMHVSVEVAMRDGSRHTATCRDPKGAWGQEELTDAEHEVKLRDCLRAGLDRKRVTDVLALLARFEDLAPAAVRKVVSLIARRRRARAAQRELW